MELVVYAPPEVLISHLDVLDHLRSEHPLRAVILRGPEIEAFEAVRQRGLEAWWLAPGLWGNVKPPRELQAEFPEVPAWTEDLPEAFESRWSMFCPTVPELPTKLASDYARMAAEMGATGIYCTHMRYHHPADVAQLWGCVCSRCRSGMKRHDISIGVLTDFLRRLAEALRSMPVRSWAQAGSPLTGTHPLIGWWASLTESDVPLRWFTWKNETLQRLLSGLAKAFRAASPGLFFASNSFEPIWAPLVGHGANTLEPSAWYSPLLGYWPTHVRQSALNLAEWHARLGSVQEGTDAVLAALENVLDADGALSEAGRGVAQELRLGSAVAAEMKLPYWPVLDGTSEAVVPLSQAMNTARETGATGVVLQGISQLLEDRTLDPWH